MKTKNQTVNLLILAIPLLFGVLACNLSAIYQIEEPRMTLCKLDSQICSLSQKTSLSPSNEQNVCIVWTEVNRPASEDLNIFIYDQNQKKVFSYVDKIVEEGGASEVSECKYVVVDESLPAGDYSTEFRSGQYSETIKWKLERNYSP